MLKAGKLLLRKATLDLISLKQKRDVKKKNKWNLRHLQITWHIRQRRATYRDQIAIRVDIPATTTKRGKINKQNKQNKTNKINKQTKQTNK